MLNQVLENLNPPLFQNKKIKNQKYFKGNRIRIKMKILVYVRRTFGSYKLYMRMQKAYFGNNKRFLLVGKHADRRKRKRILELGSSHMLELGSSHMF